MREEPEVLFDAAGTYISARYVDLLISKVFEADGGRHPVSAFTIISHPQQADNFRALFYGIDERVIETAKEWAARYSLILNAGERVKAWLELPDFPRDVVRVESPGAAGELRRLSTVG